MKNHAKSKGNCAVVISQTKTLFFFFAYKLEKHGEKVFCVFFDAYNINQLTESVPN